MSHIVPDDPATLLENYQTAMYQYHRNRRRGNRLTTRFFAREVRRFETAIGAVVDEAEIRTDGGVAITPGELAKRKRAPSSTPEADRHRCPECGSYNICYHNDKWGTARGRYYCDVCHQHVTPEGVD